MKKTMYQVPRTETIHVKAVSAIMSGTVTGGGNINPPASDPNSGDDA